MTWYDTRYPKGGTAVDSDRAQKVRESLDAVVGSETAKKLLEYGERKGCHGNDQECCRPWIVVNVIFADEVEIKTASCPSTNHR